MMATPSTEAPCRRFSGASVPRCLTHLSLQARDALRLPAVSLSNARACSSELPELSEPSSFGRPSAKMATSMVLRSAHQRRLEEGKASASAQRRGHCLPGRRRLALPLALQPRAISLSRISCAIVAVTVSPLLQISFTFAVRSAMITSELVATANS